MMRREAAFAIPGDINTVTGGYIYERRLLEELRALGHDVVHLELGASFPIPTAQDMNHAIEQLVSLSPSRALILDGLVYGSIATAGLAKVGSPIVAMIHHPLALEIGLNADLRAHLYQTERDNLALAEHVLVPSAHTAHILEAEYGVPNTKITVVRPGSQQKVRQSLVRMDEQGAGTQPPLILSVGIQHPRKGHDVLLQALSRLRAFDWRAVFVGKVHDAPHAADLKRMVRDLGLEGRVTLAGKIPQEDLETLFDSASVFALATRYEGYGMVFDEALAWGLPIVSCATGAVPQTVPSDAGILVPPDDPQALAEALRRVLKDSKLHKNLATAAAKAGRALPSWQDAARLAGGVLDGLAR